MSWRRGAVPNQKRWRAFRLTILDRDGWRCRTCGKAGRLEVDHITPLERSGAPFEASNCQSLCVGCHRLKTAAENAKPNPERLAWQKYIADSLTGNIQ